MLLQSFELRLRPLAPSPTRPPQRRRRVVPEPCGSASRGVSCSRGRNYVGRPFPPRFSSRRLARDEGRQTLAGAVLRVLAPLDGSGWLAARSESFGPRRSPWPPTLRGLLSCRSHPWSSLQSFPFPGSRARSRGSLLPCGFRARPPPAQSRKELHGRFHRSRQLFARRIRPKTNPGRMSQGRRIPTIARPVASTHAGCAARTALFPADTGLAG